MIEASPVPASDCAGQAPVVSVVMATFRRPDLLRRCLDALIDQSLPGSRYEIVVVDDGHTDDSRAVVEELALRTRGAPLLRYFRSAGTRGPAGARNLGWRRAAAPLIAFTDDDTVPQFDWLRAGLAAMCDEHTAVSGRVVVPRVPELTDHARMTQGLERAEFVTANAFVWRSSLERIGGFDERFTRPWREDSDLQFSLLEAGVGIVRADAAVVEHPVRAAPWGISIDQQANSYFEALLFKKHPDAYRLTVQPRTPWRYYFIVLCAAAAVASTLAALITNRPGPAMLALLFLALALAGMLSFALMRLRGASHEPRHVAEMLVTSLAIPFLSVYWRIRGALHFKVLFF